MASQTPRRGRAVHGLVGPVVFTARTADEMISRAESDDSEITMRQNRKDRDFAKHFATAISCVGRQTDIFIELPLPFETR